METFNYHNIFYSSEMHWDGDHAGPAGPNQNLGNQADLKLPWATESRSEKGFRSHNLASHVTSPKIILYEF